MYRLSNINKIVYQLKVYQIKTFLINDKTKYTFKEQILNSIQFLLILKLNSMIFLETFMPGFIKKCINFMVHKIEVKFEFSLRDN